MDCGWVDLLTGLSFVPLIDRSVFEPGPHCFEDCCSVVLPEVWGGLCLSICSYPQDFFGNTGSFMVHINFNINGSSSIKKNVRAYDDKDCIKPVDFLGLWLF